MTLPGFNAETSLYKTAIHYRLTGGSVRVDGVTLQQFPPPGSCFARCRRRCCPPFGACNPQNFGQRACYLECILDECE
jgi:hypothetical protein